MDAVEASLETDLETRNHTTNANTANPIADGPWLMMKTDASGTRSGKDIGPRRFVRKWESLSRARVNSRPSLEGTAVGVTAGAVKVTARQQAAAVTANDGVGAR